MDKTNGFTQDELVKEVLIEGVKLTLIASNVGNERWVLSVLNEYGINSTWIDYFESAQKAIDAGLRAIETEGVDAFVEIEGFEYLFDDNV